MQVCPVPGTVGGAQDASRLVMRWRGAVVCILLIAAALFTPALSGLFIWDDTQFANSQGIGDTLLHCFTRPFLFNYYRPLVSVSFYLENLIARQVPFLYHQTNILLHVAATALLIATLRRAFGSRRVALLGGLLFAVQPVQVSTVAWIGGRTDSLCALFVTGFAWALVHAAQAEGRRRTTYACLALLAYTGGILCKEQVIPILLLAPLAYRCFGTAPPLTWRVWLRVLWPYLIVTLGYSVAWHLVVRPPVPVPLGFATQIMQGLRTLTHYTLLFILPTPRLMHTLTLEYYARSPLPLLSGLGLLALYGGWLWRWRRSSPAACWFLALTLLTLLPICNFIPLPSLLVAPYRVGVSGVGAAAVMAFLILDFRFLILGGGRTARREGKQERRGTVSRGVFVGWLAAVIGFTVWCAGLCWWGSGRWQNEETIFKTIVRYDPDSILARCNLAAVLLNEKKRQEAIVQMESLLDRLFGSSVWQHAATAHRALQNDSTILQRARQNQGNSIRPEAWMGKIYARLGGARFDSGLLDSAREAFEVGESLDLDSPDASLGLGLCAFRSGQYADAARWLQKSVALAPKGEKGHLLLGRTWGHLGKWTAAAQEFAACIHQQPRSITPYMLLADAQKRLGDTAGMEATLRDAEAKTYVRGQTRALFAAMQRGEKNQLLDE